MKDTESADPHNQYDYRYQLFDKTKLSYLGGKELEKHSKTIDMEKDKLYLEWKKSKIFLLDLVKKREYKPEEIDLFIEDHKDLLESQDQKK